MLGALAKITGRRRKILMKTLSATCKGERVVELFEDINLPQDVAVLVVTPEREDERELRSSFGARQKSSSQSFEMTRRTKSGKGGSLMSNQFSKELRAFAEDHKWISDHLESLLNEYAEQWIAVKNRRVIASDVDLMLLREKLADSANTCVEFVTREPLEMLL
jgi:hypothetical protein